MATAREEVEEMAARCIRGEAPVYDLAVKIGELLGRPPVEVMFGECADRTGARQHLKAAHLAATRKA
jgi:hypothetical protein